jgi:hypothetical protein
MSAESSHPFRPFELDTFIDPRLARYRAILPVHAIAHFHHVAAFLLETHSGANRWLAAIPRAGHEASRRYSDRPFSNEMLGALAAELGLRPPAMADAEDRADVVLHEAEAGLRCLIDANLSQRMGDAPAASAVDRFLDLVFASLFAGLMGALHRRAAKEPTGEGVGLLGAHFVWALALFRRFELRERHATTFVRYFVRAEAVRSAAKRSAKAVAAEEEHVFQLLEELATFVAAEGPRLEEIKADPAELTRRSAPWAQALLLHELQRPGAAKRRRES